MSSYLWDTTLEDLAYSAEVYKPGGLSDRDLRFLGRAKDKGQALRLLFAAGQSDESSRGLASLQQVAEGRRVGIESLIENPNRVPVEDRPMVRNLIAGMKRAPDVSFSGARSAASHVDDATDMTRNIAKTASADATAAARADIEDAKQEFVYKTREQIYLSNYPGDRSFPGAGFISRFIPKTEEIHAKNLEDQVRILTEIRDHLAEQNGIIKTPTGSGLKTSGQEDRKWRTDPDGVQY